MSAVRVFVAGEVSSSVTPPRPDALAAAAAQTPQTQLWRRSVLPRNTRASGAVDALARRIGRFDVTHITGTVLPQVETTLVASR